LGYYGHLLISESSVEEFRARVARTEPTPAGVSAAAISASLAFALLEKVLRIVRADAALIDAAGDGSAKLLRYADDDIVAFNEYMACRRSKRDASEALRRAIEVPLQIARAANAGLKLCEQAKGLVHAFVASDLGAAKELLSGALRATLLTIDFNLGLLPPDSPLYQEMVTERNHIAS
jgi:methenyltetrahydrofolate cyclohydrolase